MLKRRTSLVIWIVAALATVFVIVQNLVPMATKPPQTKPGPIIEEKLYDYYNLIDEETGQILGYVSSVKVTTGDEYISDNNKRYVVIRVEENRAYLRSFGPADGGRDKGKFKDKDKSEAVP